MSGNVYVIAGPSGVGKGTLVRRLLAADPQLWLSVSITTRAPRPGEVDGEDYGFVSNAEFSNLVETGGLLEWAEFAGNSYGTPIAPIQKRLEEQTDVILEIDLQGVRQIRANLPESRTVFVAPPSLAALRTRLAARGTEESDAIERRLLAAEEELAAATEFDRVIVNDDLEAATDELLAWIHDHASQR